MSDIGNKEILAKNLAYYVERSGKQQKDLAEIVGVAPATFNDWMRARKYPRIDKIEKLADYFGILKSDLIEDKSKEEKEESLQDAVQQIAGVLGVTYEELAELTINEKKQELVNLVLSLPEDKVALLLRLAHSVAIED